MANKPFFLGYNTLLGDGSYVEARPSKWEQTKQALWESNLNTPFRAFYNLMNSPTIGDMSVDPTEADIANSFDAAGGMMIGGSVIPKPENALNMGIRAYHGSPHSFDKFSMDKIGTGEGAQAYGHGLYFAEQEDIAKSYRDALKNKALIDPNADMLDPKRIAGELYDSWQGDIAGALDDAKSYSNSKAVIAELNKIKANPPSGSMYEVDINADPNTFLDWDKPLSEQPEAVRAALKKLNINTGSMTAKDRVETLEAAMSGDPKLAHLLIDKTINISGNTLYKKMVEGHHLAVNPPTPFLKSQSNVTDKIREAGIPGIKYLDAGSRGAGDGTRNYVVFDDRLISIVRKYGIAGASALLGYNVLSGLNPAQAAELSKYEKGNRKK